MSGYYDQARNDAERGAGGKAVFRIVRSADPASASAPSEPTIDNANTPQPIEPVDAPASAPQVHVHTLDDSLLVVLVFLFLIWVFYGRRNA